MYHLDTTCNFYIHTYIARLHIVYVGINTQIPNRYYPEVGIVCFH